MNQTSKKPLLLLLFIPVLIAGWLLFGFMKNTDSVTKASLSSQVLGEKTFTEDDTLLFFSQLISEAESVDEAAKPLEEYEKLSLILYNLAGEENRYTLLLTSSPADCLFTDAEGKLFRIDTEHAGELLLRESMDYVNPYYSFPVFSVSTEKESLTLTDAQSGSWSYRKADGSYLTREKSPEKELSLVLPEGQAPKILFSLQPDWNEVTVKKGEQSLYTGPAEDLSAFTFHGDGELQVQISAKWNQKEGGDCYGQLQASFVFRCDVPPQFSLSATSCNPGELIVVLAKNCQNGEPSLQSELKGAEQAKVLDYCGEKLLLLPVSLDNKPGEYSLSLSGEGVSQTLKLNITKKEFSEVSLKDLSLSQLQSAHEKEEQLLTQLMATPSAQRLWQGPFSDPIGGEDTWISSRFGATVKLGNTDTGIRHCGLDYVQLPQSFVSAVNDGVVVYAGKLDYSGNTVVIDHGLGIYSVYGCLDTLNVSKDMKVYKSQTVGTLGNTGIAGGSYLHFELRVLGVPVNPFSFLGDDPDLFDLRLSGNN